MAGLDGAVTLSIPTLIGAAAAVVIATVAGFVIITIVRKRRRRRRERQAASGYSVGVARVRGHGPRRSGAKPRSLEGLGSGRTEGRARVGGAVAGSTAPLSGTASGMAGSRIAASGMAESRAAQGGTQPGDSSVARTNSATVDDIIGIAEKNGKDDEPSSWPLDLREQAHVDALGAQAGPEHRSRIARRLFGGDGRVVGLDAARGVLLAAVTLPSLITAGVTASLQSEPLGWIDVMTDDSGAGGWMQRVGFCGLLVVSGAVSTVALRASSPSDVTRLRLRRLVRSAILVGIAVVLLLAQVPGSALVMAVAVMAPMTVLLARRGTTALVLLGAGALLGVPAATSAAAVLVGADAGWAEALAPLLTVSAWASSQGAPVGVAMVSVLVGAAAARAAVGGLLARGMIAVVGMGVGGAGVAALTFAPGGELPEWASSTLLSPDRWSIAVLAVSTGAALAVCGVLLFAQRALRIPLLVASAPGSLAASLLVLVAVLGIVNARPLEMVLGIDSAWWIPPLCVVGGTVAFAVLWRLLLGDGPVERLFQLVEERLAPRVASVAGPGTHDPLAYDRVAEVHDLGAGTTEAVVAGAGAGASGPAPLERQLSAPQHPSAQLPPVRWTPGQSLGRLPS